MDILNGQEFQTLSNIQADDSGKLPSEIQVLPLGTWNTKSYGKISVTKDHITEIISNFTANVRRAVPIDVDHDKGKAAGWINSLIEKLDGLYANVEWTKYGEKLLKNKEYRLFSPEWSFNYHDPEHGTTHGAVLIAGSLTNRPLFKELPVLVASESTDTHLTEPNSVMILLANTTNMDLQTLLSKNPSELTTEEVEFVKSHQEKLSTEDKEKFAEVLNLKTEEKEETTESTENTEEKSEKTEETQKDEVQVEASELSRLKEIEEKYLVAQEELKKSAVEKEIADTFMASDNLRVLPKQKEALVDFVMTCSDEQKDKLFAILNELPVQNVEAEDGTDKRSLLTAREQVEKIIEDYKAADGTITETQAQDKVQREHKELWNQYKEELNN